MKELRTYCESLFDIEDDTSLIKGRTIGNSAKIKNIDSQYISLEKNDPSLILDYGELEDLLEVSNITGVNKIKCPKEMIIRPYNPYNKIVDLNGLEFYVGGRISIQLQPSYTLRNGKISSSSMIWLSMTDQDTITFENMNVEANIIHSLHFPFVNTDNKCKFDVNSILMNWSDYSANTYTKLYDEFLDIQGDSKRIKTWLNHVGVGKIDFNRFYTSSEEGEQVVFVRRGRNWIVL